MQKTKDKTLSPVSLLLHTKKVCKQKAFRWNGETEVTIPADSRSEAVKIQNEFGKTVSMQEHAQRQMYMHVKRVWRGPFKRSSTFGVI